MARKKVDPAVSEYMGKIGKKGGKKTSKTFTSERARALLKIRWEKWRRERKKP